MSHKKYCTTVWNKRIMTIFSLTNYDNNFNILIFLFFIFNSYLWFSNFYRRHFITSNWLLLFPCHVATCCCCCFVLFCCFCCYCYYYCCCCCSCRHHHHLVSQFVCFCFTFHFSYISYFKFCIQYDHEYFIFNSIFISDFYGYVSYVSNRVFQRRTRSWKIHRLNNLK